ncbi:MAG: hypothetical protein SVU88_00730 [Candidatus Nanohaloarchaea archaeon]|nr:hypothetical protein [Candidatus Nanohaloarchaea archaeon]
MSEVARDILPDWLDDILAHEYDADIDDGRRRAAGDRFWRVGRRFDSFERFYQEVVEGQEEGRLNGDNRAHSIENYWCDRPWNCLGKVVFASAVADIGMGETVDVVLQSMGKEHPQTGTYWQNQAHVKVKGPDGEEYGPDAPYADRVDGRGTVVEGDRIYTAREHSEDVLVPLYHLSDAKHAWANDRQEDTLDLIDEAESNDAGAAYVNRKIDEIRRFGF